MRRTALAALAVLFGAMLSACGDKPLPDSIPSPGPDDQAAPSADRPYRPVMAGTVWHGVGDRP